jgi:hypothetical protein
MTTNSFTEEATLTIKNYRKKLIDNMTNDIPLLFYINQKGNIKEDEADGGTVLLENLEYGDNASFKWFSGYETLDVTPSDVVTSAEFAWKQCNANVIFSGKEVAINKGESKRFDLIDTKTRNAENTIRNNLGAAMYYSNTESDGKAPGGLQHIVADAPATGTVGGIDRSVTANAWWRNQVLDFSVDTPGASGTASATNMLAAARKLYMRCQRNSDVTDLVIFGETYYDYFEGALQQYQQFTNTTTADGGFQVLRWKGAKVLYDPNCSTTRGYFLQTKYLKLRPHKDVNFAVGDERLPTNQDATVIPINWMGNVTGSNLSLQGVMIA